jgi:hypothetical protein
VIGCGQLLHEPLRALWQTVNAEVAIIFENDHFLRRVAAEPMRPSNSVPARPTQRFALAR